MKTDTINQSFSATLEECLESIVLDNQDMQAAWAVLHETVYNTAMQCLGPASRWHKEWFDENCAEITQFLENKRHAYKAHLDDPTPTTKKEEQAQHHPAEAASDKGLLV